MEAFCNVVRRAAVFLVCVAALAGVAKAQSCHLKVSGVTQDGKPFKGEGTCFCIGMTTADKQLWMTAAHNFQNVRTASVTYHGVEYNIPQIRRHASEDIALFETELIDEKFGWEFGPADVGASVKIPGYGSLIHGGPKISMQGVMASAEWIDGVNGEHVITGDSGAPVLTAETFVAGVVTGHQTPAIRRTAARSDFAEQRLQTLIVPYTKCQQFVQQHYGGGQCGPGGCGPVWIDPMVVQPRRGITWPAGPPQVIPIARPAPQVYVPQQQSRPVIPEAGESGSPSASVPYSAVKAAVDSYLRENGEKLRGPAGSVGPAGPAGKDGKDGKDGKNGGEKPVTVIFAKGRREIDRETFQPGAAIVINTDRLLQALQQQEKQETPSE